MLWLDQFEHDIDAIVLYIFAAVSAINLVLALGILILGCIIRADTPGSSMNFYVSFGALAIVACNLIVGLNPTDLSEDIMSAMCQFYPALLCYGLVAFIGGLLVRCVYIFVYYVKEDTYQKVHKHEWKPNMFMFMLLLIEAAPILIWIMMYDLKSEVTVIGTTGSVMCVSKTTDDHKWFKVGLSAYHAALMILAGIFVWPAIFYSRKSPSEVEANILSVIVWNMIFAAGSGAVVFFLFETSLTYMYAIIGGLTQYVVFITLLLLLIAKIVVARRIQRNNGGD